MGGPWARPAWLAYLPTLLPDPARRGFRRAPGRDRQRHWPARATAGHSGPPRRTSHAPAEAVLADVHDRGAGGDGQQGPRLPRPAGRGRVIADRLAGAYAMIPDAGHYPQSEFPELTTPVVLDFARRVAAGAAGCLGPGCHAPSSPLTPPSSPTRSVGSNSLSPRSRPGSGSVSPACTSTWPDWASSAATSSVLAGRELHQELTRGRGRQVRAGRAAGDGRGLPHVRQEAPRSLRRERHRPGARRRRVPAGRRRDASAPSRRCCAGYGLTGDDAIHAIRGLRALMHGFVSLEAAGGFAMPQDLDESYRAVGRSGFAVSVQRLTRRRMGSPAGRRRVDHPAGQAVTGGDGVHGVPP